MKTPTVLNTHLNNLPVATLLKLTIKPLQCEKIGNIAHM